jgi:hypothetical protein
MSSANRKVWVIRGAVILACSLGCFFIGRETAKERGFTEVAERVDTLFIRDTLTQKWPVYYTRYVHDTIYVRADTVRINDTLYVPLPREVRIYEDSMYRAEVSGYEPSLDRIDIYQRKEVITQTATIYVQEAKRWGIGVQAGYGATARDGSVYLSPYIGIGISYDIIRW